MTQHIARRGIGIAAVAALMLVPVAGAAERKKFTP